MYGWQRHTTIHQCDPPKLDRYGRDGVTADEGDTWMCACGESYTVVTTADAYRIHWDRTPIHRYQRITVEYIGQPNQRVVRYGPIIPDGITLSTDPPTDRRPADDAPAFYQMTTGEAHDH